MYMLFGAIKPSMFFFLPTNFAQKKGLKPFLGKKEKILKFWKVLIRNIFYTVYTHSVKYA